MSATATEGAFHERISTGRRIIGNTALNFAGYVLPMVVGLLTVPPMLHKLGTARFGALMLVFTALGYLSPLDLGIGRAATRALAEALGRDQRDRLSSIAWTSITFLFSMGVIGALGFAAVVPLMVDRFLSVPLPLRGEVKLAFYLAAAALPFLTTAAAVRGVLEALGRFDLTNSVKIAGSTARYGLPLVALYAGMGLTGAVAVLTSIMVLTVLCYLCIDFAVLPELRTISIRWSFIREQLSFGLWTSLSGAAILGNNYMDRTLIGSTLGLSAVTWYSAPQELSSRLSIFPTSIVTTLFPIFSARGCDEKTATIHTRSVRSLVILMAPICAFLICLAPDILRVWLGPESALHSTFTLRMLVAGMFINAVGFPTFTLLQGIGRPEVATKFFLAELPVFGTLIYLALHFFGLSGAACVYVLRSAAEVIWYWMSLRGINRDLWHGATALARPFLCATILMVPVAVSCVVASTVVERGAVFLSAFIVYTAVTKYAVLQKHETKVFTDIYHRVRTFAAARLCLLESLL